MKKILVTGAQGQLGTELNFLSTLHPFAAFTFAGHASLDISREDEVNEYLGRGRYDYLINCAAYTAVDKAESEKDKAYLINAEGAGYLAAACRENNCRFIHISTDFVFDGLVSRPLTEEDAVNPLGIYGASKLAGERLIMANNPQALIIRTAWVYSSFGNNFVKTILRLCKERESINVVADQVGTPTYARNLAQALLHIAEKDIAPPGVYHYSNEGVASWYDFAMAIRDMAGLKTEIQPIATHQYPTPAARPAYSVLNKTKFKQASGLAIPYWRNSLQQCIQLIIN